MVGLKILQLAGLAALGSATALQLPLGLSQPGEQAPLAGDHISADANTAARPLVETEALQALIKGENLLSRAKDLYSIAELSVDQYNHPTRVIGSEGHKGTLSYIWKTISGLRGYYKLSQQSFNAVSGNVYEYRLVLGNGLVTSARPMGLTPPTKDKEPVDGDVVLVAGDGCDASDYPEAMNGTIALIRRGTCPFGDKSDLAGKAGAVAAIVYNYEDSGMSGTLGSPTPDQVATFGISGKDAAPFIKKLQSGEKVDAIAYMDSEVENILTNNIIAQTVQGDQDNCVMLGGHSDSVSEGPGINDDGSGSLSLLEVATQLTRFSVNNCVRFGWFAAEEEGLLGSDHYVQVLPREENLKIRVFMDYDMMASPNYVYQIYNATNDVNPLGSQELRDLYVDWYEGHGLNYTFVPFDGRSDYDGFIRNDIPGGGIATGAEGIKTKEEEGLFGGKAGDWYDPCYHQLCDHVGNVNLTAWEINTKLIAHSVATFAFSFDGFPKRSIDSVGARKSAQPAKYHGHKLVI